MRSFGRRRLLLAAATALLVSAGPAAVLGAQETAKLPPVPPRAVELDRARTAKIWNSRFCSRWTDGCFRCFKPVALANTAVCDAEDAAENCSPSAIRCLEFDAVIAPLFCTGLNDGCGGTTVATSGPGGELFAASNDYCLGRKDRPPTNWVCHTAQKARDDCAKEHTGYRSVRHCVRVSQEASRQYRRAMERLVRDSNRLAPR